MVLQRLLVLTIAVVVSDCASVAHSRRAELRALQEPAAAPPATAAGQLPEGVASATGPFATKRLMKPRVGAEVLYGLLGTFAGATGLGVLGGVVGYAVAPASTETGPFSGLARAGYLLTGASVGISLGAIIAAPIAVSIAGHDRGAHGSAIAAFVGSLLMTGSGLGLGAGSIALGRDGAAGSLVVGAVLLIAAAIVGPVLGSTLGYELSAHALQQPSPEQPLTSEPAKASDGSGDESSKTRSTTHTSRGSTASSGGDRRTGS
jgi:hypothetical protein